MSRTHTFDRDLHDQILELHGAAVAARYRQSARSETLALLAHFNHVQDPTADEDRAYRVASGMLSGRGQ